MPAQYEAIRDNLIKSGKSTKEAKSIAAATYIKRGGGKKGRSARAKSLHSDSNPFSKVK